MSVLTKLTKIMSSLFLWAKIYGVFSILIPEFQTRPALAESTVLNVYSFLVGSVFWGEISRDELLY